MRVARERRRTAFFAHAGRHGGALRGIRSGRGRIAPSAAARDRDRGGRRSRAGGALSGRQPGGLVAKPGVLQLLRQQEPVDRRGRRDCVLRPGRGRARRLAQAARVADRRLEALHAAEKPAPERRARGPRLQDELHRPAGRPGPRAAAPAGRVRGDAQRGGAGLLRGPQGPEAGALPARLHRRAPRAPPLRHPGETGLAGDGARRARRRPPGKKSRRIGSLCAAAQDAALRTRGAAPATSGDRGGRGVDPHAADRRGDVARGCARSRARVAHADRLMDPRYGFQGRLKREFPSQVVVDAAEVCNLACVHCPHPEFKKSPHYSGAFLEPALNAKMVDEVAEHGRGHTLYIRYTSNGEPLVHPGIYDMLDYAVRRSGVFVTLTTNGTTMNEKRVRKLLESGLHLVDVSIDALEWATYAAVRVNGRLPVTRDNVRSLIRMKQETGAVTRIAVSFVEQERNRGEAEAFERFWRAEGADRVVIRRLHSAAGGVPVIAHMMKREQGAAPRYPCLYPW